MARQFNFNFRQDDDALMLTGYVNFPEDSSIGIDDFEKVITVRGLGVWRHVPANIIHVNEEFLEKFKVASKALKLSKIGINYIGLKAKSNVLLSYNLRQGRNGYKKVIAQLDKFFRALGASSVHIEKENGGDEPLHE
jgi:hypothetical protein